LSTVVCLISGVFAGLESRHYGRSKQKKQADVDAII